MREREREREGEGEVACERVSEAKGVRRERLGERRKRGEWGGDTSSIQCSASLQFFFSNL